MLGVSALKHAAPRALTIRNWLGQLALTEHPDLRCFSRADKIRCALEYLLLDFPRSSGINVARNEHNGNSWLSYSMVDEIIVDARRHLAQSLAFKVSSPDYGSRWQPQVEAMRRDISALTDPIACLHYAQQNITFDVRNRFPADPMMLQFLEWAVENEFPQYAWALAKLSDNPLSRPDTLGVFKGRTNISNALFYHARTVLAGITYADKPRRVLEIGAGYGEIARVWVNNPVACAESYVIVDIPECLFFSEIALRTEFGRDVGYFDGHDPGTKILLVPIPYLAKLNRACDLVISSGSMQETTDEWVDFYMTWLKDYDTHYFYSINYAAQPLSVMGESRNLWAPRPGADWSTRHLRLNIPLIDIIGPTRDLLEALYEKQPATRTLAEWSVHRGHILSKTTYVEGLDLLRQNFTIENAREFVDAVLERMPYHPKELLYVVEWLLARGRREYEGIRTTLRSELGGMLEHHPDPPMGTARA